MASIVYTKTDEAPALATCSLLPIIKTFTEPAGIEVTIQDLSLAGRIIANFPENLTDNQKQSDALMELGELAKTPEANIIKLPNISASIPQLTAAIRELQKKGYDIPDYPEEPQTEAEREIKDRYAKVLGSAVNPVLREGNSDRRVASAVKEYAKNNPHPMGEWTSESQSHVAYMRDRDFYGSEQSVVSAKDDTLKIEFVDTDGNTTILKDDIPVQAAEVVDAMVMNCRALRAFYETQLENAKNKGILFSLHLKATMMKVSDPILFGHAVSVYYKDVFEKHAAVFDKLGIDPNNGIGEVYTKIARLPESQRAEIESDIAACYTHRPDLAMVNSDRGITNLHVPSDVIIDASMPAAIRESGQMWGPDGELRDTIYTIPDRSYARIYSEIIDFHKEHGTFDITTMGNVSNVGLMAQKAEEYGSHDKTYEIPTNGRIRVVDTSGQVLLNHEVEKGDIWRACQTRDLPIRDWVNLAVNRARHNRISGHILAGRKQGARQKPNRQSRYLFERLRHKRFRHPNSVPNKSHARNPATRQKWKRHHLCHRQCLARLPHRPVSHSRTGNQCKNAFNCTPSGRRKPFRNRRRRLCSQARTAICRRRAFEVGFNGRNIGTRRIPRRPGT